MHEVHYLDANATQPLRPAARDAVLAAFAVVGNPSKVHHARPNERPVMEDAREAIARLFGGLPENLVFTSGGTAASASSSARSSTMPSDPPPPVGPPCRCGLTVSSISRRWRRT